MSNERPYKLMIDPGHGGRDPGTVNKELGIMEKDINLRVSQLMHKIIVQGDYLYEPFVTRREDVYVSLFNRALASSLWNVDAFLSIHCNSRPRPGKHGLEIESYHFPGSKLGTEYAQHLTYYLIDALKDEIECFDRGAKPARFYVLRKTKMPAALIELGFLCDNEEALFLNKKKNQRIVAKALAEASEHFLEGGGT